MSVDTFNLLKPASSVLFVGPSGCGKTMLLKKLLDWKMIETRKILLFYQNWQPLYDGFFPNIEFYKYWIEKNPEDSKNYLEDLIVRKNTTPLITGSLTIIFDDALPFCKLPVMEEMFTRMCHHYNINVLMTVQNLFEPSLRVITRNCHYMFLFKNPRDAAQIRHLAYQIYPDKSHARVWIRSLKEITSQPYRAALLDFKPNTPDYMRLRSDFFSTDGATVHCMKDDNIPESDDYDEVYKR